MKFNVQYDVGKVKYLVSYYDGIKKHSDGSEFWEIKCFNSKKKMFDFLATLQ